MSDIFVDNIKHQSSQGSGTITIGASGESVTVPNGSLTGQNYPAFLLEGNGTLQTISNASHTKVTNFSTTIDTDSATSSGTFTVPTGKSGKYLLFACTSWAANATGQRLVQIRKNSSEIMRISSFAGESTNNNVLANGSGLLDLTAGDDLELFCYQNSGGNLGLQTNSAPRVRFGGYRIGA